MERDRHSDILLRLAEKWDSEEMQKARDKVIRVWRKDPTGGLVHEFDRAPLRDPLLTIQLHMPGDFFEVVGLLVIKKLLSPQKLIISLYGPDIKLYYNIYKPHIDSQRPRRPEIYEYFEELYKLTLPNQAQRRLPPNRVKTTLSSLLDVMKRIFK